MVRITCRRGENASKRAKGGRNLMCGAWNRSVGNMVGMKYTEIIFDVTYSWEE